MNTKYVDEGDKLDYPNEQFDLGINRHESFDVTEVYRVLKHGGHFITQQVGNLNDRELVEKLLGHIPLPFPQHDLKHNVELSQNSGFIILKQMEEMSRMKLYDLGAVVYFAKQIVWEFPGFSVQNCLEQLNKLREEINQKGHISNKEHRFLIVARKQ